MDLKDEFFCIPFTKESQYLFVFEWEAPGEKRQQMTWTVLPQGYRESPQLLGQALSQELLDLDLGPNGKMPPKQAIQGLNFLGERGYKVSHAKAQIFETKVTYLGVQIAYGPRKLSSD